MELIGKIIGYIAVGVSIIIYQQKTKKGLLICKAVADALWIIHYLCLGGYSGAAITGVALLRELLFIRSKIEDTKGKIVLVCFLGASIGCSILTWSSIFSLFALLGSMMSVISFWIGKPKISRWMAFPISACMLTYGLSIGSVAVVINEILTISSSIIGILVIDRKKPSQT